MLATANRVESGRCISLQQFLHLRRSMLDMLEDQAEAIGSGRLQLNEVPEQLRASMVLAKFVFVFTSKAGRCLFLAVLFFLPWHAFCCIFQRDFLFRILTDQVFAAFFGLYYGKYCLAREYINSNVSRFSHIKCVYTLHSISMVVYNM